MGFSRASLCATLEKWLGDVVGLEDRSVPAACSSVDTCDPSCGLSLLPFSPLYNLTSAWQSVPAFKRSHLNYHSRVTRSAAMTSTQDSKRLALLEERRRSPLDQLPPPANSDKPLTPFSIEDILNKPSVRRSYSLSEALSHISPEEKFPSGCPSLTGRALLRQSSPLCALEELASKTFIGLEVSVLQAAEGRDGLTLFGQRNTPKKRRKSRTAFTNQQIYELEKRFLYQKYLSPADRDQIAQQLGLTNAQVITWFQNRRAKLKRDLEEMKADVESAKAAGSVALEKLSKLAELEKCAAGGMGGGTVSAPGHTDPEPVASRSHPNTTENLDSSRKHMSPPSPESSWCTDRLSIKSCSEDEDEEIDVDD